MARGEVQLHTFTSLPLYVHFPLHFYLYIYRTNLSTPVSPSTPKRKYIYVATWPSRYLSDPIPSHPIPSHCIALHCTTFHSNSSQLRWASYPIASHRIPSHPIPSTHPPTIQTPIPPPSPPHIHTTSQAKPYHTHPPIYLPRTLPQPPPLLLTQALKLRHKPLAPSRPLEKLHQKPLRLIVLHTTRSGPILGRKRHELLL